MRNNKKLIAVIMTIAILASMMVPALAASNTTQFEALQAAGLMLGTGATTDVDLGKPLNRIQGFVLVVRAMGVEATAAAMTEAEIAAALATVEDAATIPAWGRAHAAYVVENGITVGVGGAAAGMIKFAPTSSLTGLQFITMMLRAMNYSGVTLANCVDKAIESGMLTASQAVAVATKDSFLRDDAALVLFNAVKGGMLSVTGATPGAVKLIDSLVAANAVTTTAAVAFGYVAPTPAPAPALTVSSIVANNLKTVVVNFNREVDKDSVTTDTVKVTDKVSTVSVSADKKSATIIMNATLAQSETIEIDMNGVKDANKVAMAASKQKVVVTDTAIPQITGVVVKDAKHFEILASEPINKDSAGAFTVLSEVVIGGSSAIAKVTPDFAANKLKIELASAKAAGTYTLEIKDLVDFATYKAVTLNTSLIIPSDTTAPTITSATLKTPTSIEVVFDGALASTDIGTYKVNGTSATAAFVADSENTKVLLTGFGTPGIAALVELKVAYKDQKDIAGNKVSTEQTFTFKVDDDTVLPTATVTVGDGNKVTVNFSKGMLASAGTIRLLDKDSKVLKTFTQPFTFTDSNNNAIEYSAATLGLDNADVAKYFIKLSDMKDATVRGNGLVEVSLPFDSKDTKKPTVNANYLVTNGTKTGADTGKDDTVTFFFSEAMDLTTLQNLSNYVYGGVSFAATADVVVKSVASDAKSIVITYPQARTALTGNATVYAIKDVAGNMMVTKTDVAKYGAAPITLGSAKATAKNKIEVTYSASISSADPSTLVVKKAAEAYAVGIAVAIDGAKVTYTLSNALDSTATTGFTIESQNVTLVKTAFGDTLTAYGPVAFTDEIRPEIVEVTAGVEGTATNNKLTMKFSEVLNAASITNAKNDLVIRDKDGNLVADANYELAMGSTNAFVIITFLPASNIVDGTQDVTVALANDRYLADTTGNKVVTFAAKTVSLVADAVAPTVSQVEWAVGADDKVVTITFSEAMQGLAQANFSSVAGGAITAFVVAPTNTVVTITFTNNVVAASTVVMTADVMDLVGNSVAVAGRTLTR